MKIKRILALIIVVSLIMTTLSVVSIASSTISTNITGAEPIPYEICGGCDVLAFNNPTVELIITSTSILAIVPVTAPTDFVLDLKVSYGAEWDVNGAGKNVHLESGGTYRINVAAGDGFNNKSYLLTLIRDTNTTAEPIPTIEPTEHPKSSACDVLAVVCPLDSISINNNSIFGIIASGTSFPVRYIVSPGARLSSDGTGIKVTAEDGITSKTYTVSLMPGWWSYSALDNIAFDHATISPSFERDISTYTTTVDSRVEKLRITIDPDQYNLFQSMTINNVYHTLIYSSGKYYYDINTSDLSFGENIIIISVSSESGNDSRLYKIKLTKVLSENTQTPTSVTQTPSPSPVPTAPPTAAITATPTTTATQTTTATPTPFVTPKTFPDVNPDNYGWAQESVEYLAGLNIINGSVVDGQLMYLPANTITRAELCKLIVVAYGFTQDGQATAFTDIDGHWAVDHIAIASSQGIVKGYEDNTFKPDSGISREELAVMISRAMLKKNIGSVIPEEQVNEKLSIFLDQASIDDWARNDVAYTVDNGIIKGSPVEGGGFNFLPLDTANRAETAVMIKRAYDKHTIALPANKGSNNLRKIEDMQGYVPEEDIKSQGGEITRKELMTYKEYCDLNIVNGYSPLIDDDRMMWVMTIKYIGQHMIGDTLREDPVIITVWDAETGNMLVQSFQWNTNNN